MHGLVEIIEELVLIAIIRHGQAADISPCDHESIGMHRITGVRYQDHVARLGQCHGQMRQTLLGTHGDDGLVVWIQDHAIAVPIPVADGTAQTGNAPGLGVAMGTPAPCHFLQLGDHMGRRCLIGIAHAEVDDVLAPGPGSPAPFIDRPQDIGRQPFYTSKAMLRHALLMVLKDR